MITLDKNYRIDTDSTHGFQLLFESDSMEKEVTTKKGKEIKDVTTKETYYFPKLSQTLEKYYSLNLLADNEKDLLERVISVENNINNFSRTFAIKGKIKQL